MKKLLRFILFSVAAIVVTAIAFSLVTYISINEPPGEKPADCLRITSMNIMMGNMPDSYFSEKLVNTGSDIIVIIEWNGNNMLLHKFKEKGYRVLLDHPRKAVHGICVLGRMSAEAAVIESPVVTPCALPLGNIRFSYKGRSFSPFAVHAPPPVSSCKGTNNAYLHAISGWIEKGVVIKQTGVAKKDDIAILAGDFNSLPWDDEIKEIKGKGMHDAFGGLSLTETTWKPLAGGPYLARIDYLIASDKLRTLNAYRFIVPGSDHLGITADYVFIND